MILEPAKNLEFRTQAHLFVPYQRIEESSVTGDAFYAKEFEDRWLMASAALVYHSPLGPVSVSANYYDADQQLSFLVHFGYIIFNNRSSE